jgi:hypothetical protein
MSGTIDDRRAASNITATLSSYLMTAALGVIAAEAVIVTFVLDKREHLAWFYLFSAVGLVSSVASIFFGGKGIFKLTKRGFDGDWVIRTTGGHFNRQAWFALSGVVLVAFSAFCGNSKPETRPQEIEILKTNINELRGNLSALEAKYESLSARLNSQSVSNKPATTQNRKKKKTQ